MMKTVTKQPLPTELQNLHQLFQRGQLPQAEIGATLLLERYPKSLAVLNLLGMCQQGQGKFRAAASSFSRMLSIDPGIAEIHFNLATLQTQLNDIKAALACYRKSLQIKPDFTLAHFNLGALLQQQGLYKQAAEHYQQAVRLEANFYEAWVNWGAVLQIQGELQVAEHCYRKALELRIDARGYFNLGTTLYGLGEHPKALEAFQAALQLNPQFADAWNALGETYRDQGDMQEAVRAYREALRLEPKHARANYNMGESYCLSGQLTQSIPYFKASNFADAKERVLLSLYKTRQFEDFKQGLVEVMGQDKPDSVLLGSLSTHYAINFCQSNPYGFCRNPMDFVQVAHIDELSAPNSPFLGELLDSVKHLAIAERKQGRLYYGIQSAGNLLQRSEPCFQKLAAIIRAKIYAYQKFFSTADAALMRLFPQELAFASSWYLRMKQGGYLTSHIHEEGWISGCVYLQLPDKLNQHEGSFEYGVDGDDYPRLHENFPKQIIDQKVGDLVLFPSSLFHRTLPFHSAQERICIAFDIKP
jgi:tetratricopeptide (TPR) repeat protein